ncbi:MAG: PAS domain-containing protein, partial [Hymenobacteraceae bacterium]|nr:PAS domain-containing protein [Hymenobacteraceae bacterium]MDX5395416.1 PAS domain-containing protein [Hymenobacteraceae bacterium]MDX5511465.1 PAS domain-containing protein [Hymenobacteraceae bacterium]
EDVNEAATVFTEASDKKEQFSVNYRLRRSDGVYRWIITTGTPRFNSDGKFLGYIGSAIDITDHIEAERKVRQNAELLQKILLEAPALVGLVRASDQVYTLVNQHYSQLFGNRPLLNRNIREAHPDLEGQGLFKKLDEVIRSGKSFTGNEVPISIDRTNSGKLVKGYFNLVYQPLLNHKQQVDDVLIFAIEVTELVKSRQKLSNINDELSQKNKELVQINTDLDNFVYTASHDLKSPIANLEGLTYFMQDSLTEKLNEDEMQLLEMVNISVNKLKQTITDLTEITKVQKQQDTVYEPLSVVEVLEDVKADLEPLLPLSEVDLQLNLEVEYLPYARKNLRSILYNLLSNAIKYRKPDKQVQIKLSTHDTPEYVVLSVQDNGLGLKKGQLQKLFSMFTRLHSHVEGSGIGLYMIKRMVENMEGKIEVDSELGEGTTFKVYFKKHKNIPAPATVSAYNNDQV